MTDDHPLKPYGTGKPPARPVPSMPVLPASSGAWIGTRTTIVKKDTAFIEAHAELLKAKRTQNEAMIALIESRITAALAMARIAALPEIAQHEYQRGRTERVREQNAWHHEARVAELDRERIEIDAKTALITARRRLAEVERPPAEPPPPPPAAAPPTGLMPEDVEEVLGALPEIAPETLETIRRLLAGFLKEKQA